ncbi:hypothetical protein NL50_09280 [Clostridium acetobutylicum]|nr:hypothetical protein NL50_09280 [Clostridium acetobutylicum]
MKNFSETIKNFDKIRDYVRDFYIYGFKSRNDFTRKSLRTYDNEKRRIESYFEKYVSYNSSFGEKNAFISVNSSTISHNPLYSVWKAKSFTDNDIMLHFYLLDLLSNRDKLSIKQLTDEISINYGTIFELQTVRNKANEYVKEGILISTKLGKTLYYSLNNSHFNDLTSSNNNLLDCLKYYQETAPFGVIGSYILQNENKENDIFRFKHHFIAHTLEDKILFEILSAIKEKREISFIVESPRNRNKAVILGIPLKIFVSTQTGRRYLNIYNTKRNRFVNHRLDYIKSVKPLDKCNNYDFLKEKLINNLDKCWGVSFGNNSRKKVFKAKLYINEKAETYIINRINKEGRGGTLERLKKNTYLYSKEVFDPNELMSWIKSFIGRIISIESGENFVDSRFFNDMEKLKEMYLNKEDS